MRPIQSRERLSASQRLKPIDLDKLRAFQAAAEAGSFTHAGEIIGLSQSAVSRQVSALEAELGVTLFHRHARGLRLTEQGELLFRTAKDVLLRLENTRAKLMDTSETPRGELRVTTSVGLGSGWLAPRMKEFAETYPDVSVQLILTDEELDLAMRAADVAIWLRPPTQADLIQRKLFTVHCHVYASPDYLAEFGTPIIPEDLDSHRVVSMGPPIPTYLQGINWLQHVGREGQGSRHSVLQVNNIIGMKRAVQNGVGLALLPDYIIGENAGLVRIMEGEDMMSFEAYFAYPAEMRSSQRVNIFREFLLAKAQSWSF